MSLIGHEIRKSSEFNKSVENLVHSVQEQNNKITEIRPPKDPNVQKNNELCEKVHALRGRPLFYKYVGTGAGNGPYVELEDGSVKMDLINGIGIHIMGHGHPGVMRAAIEGATADVIMQGNLQLNNEWIRLSEKLVSIASKNSRLKHCWITTSGSMANENALKMARQKNSPARKILSMFNEFAGRTTMMTEISDNPAYKVGLPTYDEVLRVPFYEKTDVKSSEKALEIVKKHIDENKGNIAAFAFEPMLGEGGYKVAPRDYFVPILEECKKNNIAVWADEIQTFCRTGEMFAFEKIGFGEYVDLCTVAKTIQIGATLYTEDYNPNPGLIAGTFAGATSQLTAGYEILRTLTEDGYLGKSGKIQKIHDEFVGMLNELNETTCKGKLRDAGGLGLMIAVTPFDGEKDQQISLLKKLYENGVIAFGCGRDPFRIRFLVPAIMTNDDIRVVKSVLEKSMQETGV